MPCQLAQNNEGIPVGSMLTQLQKHKFAELTCQS